MNFPYSTHFFLLLITVLCPARLQPSYWNGCLMEQTISNPGSETCSVADDSQWSYYACTTQYHDANKT